MKSLKTLLSGTVAMVFVLFSAALTTNTDKVLDATEWEIDKAHSKLAFTVTHFFTPVTGQFTEYNSNIHFDPDNLEESRIDVEVMVNSIDTDNQKRDGHLQSPDFFNAEKFPTITFTSNEIAHESGNNYVATGELTIKDVTQEIGLPFTLLGVRDHPMREGVRLAGIKFTKTIDRNTYNVGTGDWVATAVVDDEVEITGTLELNTVKQQASN